MRLTTIFLIAAQLVACTASDDATAPAEQDSGSNQDQATGQYAESFVQDRYALDLVVSVAVSRYSIEPFLEQDLFHLLGQRLADADVDLRLVMVDSCPVSPGLPRTWGPPSGPVMTDDVPHGLPHALSFTGDEGLTHVGHHMWDSEPYESVRTEINKLLDDEEEPFRRDRTDFAVLAISNTVAGTEEVGPWKFSQWLNNRARAPYRSRYLALAPIEESCEEWGSAEVAAHTDFSYEQVLQWSDGLVLSYCSSQRKSRFEQLVTELLSPIARYNLTYRATPGSITVRVRSSQPNGTIMEYPMLQNAQNAASRFTYDDDTRTIVFPHHRPATGAEIEIMYVPRTPTGHLDTGTE